MFNWLKRSAGPSRVVGIDLQADGCALAVIDNADAGSPVVTAVKRCHYAAIEDRAKAIAVAVRSLGIRGVPAVVTLDHSAYSLVQLEAPDMPLEELREAMRWRVKDLIGFPVEEAVVDVFRLPQSQRPGAPPLLYAVVAKKEAISQAVEALKDAGLEIRAIDVLEMSIRNLALLVDRPERPRAYLHLLPGETVIEIADGPQIYLTRRVLQDYDVDADAELLHAQMENLALEVQRSLDYFESQYAFGPADRLSVLVCADRLYGAFEEVAKTFLTVSVERFEFNRVTSAEGVELADLGRGIGAVGAAMRGAA